jgi:hypothetical protein
MIASFLHGWILVSQAAAIAALVFMLGVWIGTPAEYFRKDHRSKHGKPKKEDA